MDFIESNEVFITSVLKSNASSVVESILSEQIMFDMRQHLKDERLEELKTANDMLAALYTGAIVALGKWWITQKNRPPKSRSFSSFLKSL